jgi:DnaJ-class molecular chaperone
MNSGGTRAGQAAGSRRVKQELVRLLFGAKYSRTGPEGHKKLDSASYSYADLKRAYFSKLQEIHPDKNKAATSLGSDSKQHFHDLQKTWEQYSDMAKAMEKVQSNGQGDFTKFGVGCSFSDNDIEKELRTEIMDQACRGWFSSGELPASNHESTNSSFRYAPSSLIDDDMFVEIKSDTKKREEVSVKRKESNGRAASARTLIPGYKG